MDDDDLASRFASGDADSVRVVYQTYGRLVFSIAFKVLGDAGLAEDATQQTFVQAWRAAGSYDPSRALAAWLTTIAKRVAIDVYRRERRHRNVDSLDTADSASLVTLPPSIDQMHDVAVVRQALDELPPTDRALIRMHHFDELSHAEIAHELEIPLGTVKSRTFRAHRRLAGILANLRADPADSSPTARLPWPGITVDGSKGVPMDDTDLTPGERAELEQVRHVLADPAVWREPAPDLQEAVVAAIAEEARAGRQRRRIRTAVAGVAATVLLAAGVTVGLQANHAEPVEFAASLGGTELAPDAAGDVTLTKTPSGWKIRLNVTGLPRRADGEFYEAWLKDDAGLLVPIGTFNDGHDVTLWSGVRPTTFPTLTVTREVADGDQASSGQVVLMGQADAS
jgi:RNA polymerase sigma factor (sigma-70 family)